METRSSGRSVRNTVRTNSTWQKWSELDGGVQAAATSRDAGTHVVVEVGTQLIDHGLDRTTRTLGGAQGCPLGLHAILDGFLKSRLGIILQCHVLKERDGGSRSRWITRAGGSSENFGWIQDRVRVWASD